MSGFTLHLQSAARYERIEDVASFVGEDASGSFGILGIVHIIRGFRRDVP